MSIKNLLIGLALIAISILAILFTGGVLIPVMLPLFLYGLKFMGLKIE